MAEDMSGNSETKGLIAALQKLGLRKRPPGTEIDPLSGEPKYKAPPVKELEK